MSPTLTSVLAVWGAVLSTATLAWRVWKWSRENPKIVARVEARENPSGDGGVCIHYEIRNRGGRPTTIEEVMLVKYEDGIGGLLGIAEAVEYESAAHRATVKLPMVLGPGEVWKGYAAVSEEGGALPMDKRALIQTGRLSYKVRCAHSDRLVSGRVRPEEDSMRL